MNELVIIIVLILINGVLAMSEIALISVRKSQLLNEVRRGSNAARTALKLAGEPDKFLSTVQIGITLVGILTGIYSGSVIADSFSDLLVVWGFPAKISHPFAQSLIVIVVTYFTLVFGELVPKRIGMTAAEPVAKVVARPMHWLSLIASPFVWLLAKSTAFVFGLFGLSSDSGKVTEEEIKSMIDEGAKGGEVQAVEQDIMQRVFVLGDLKVNSLMTHRSDVVALDIHMDVPQIKQVMQENLYELYPVVDANFDHLIGTVALKDLVFNLEKENFELKNVVLPPVYFPENMSVYKALERMKEQRISQALICDEFGSFQGIITLKDILGGLVGTIQDTHSDPMIIKRKEGEGWFVDGQCPLYDLLAYFDREDLFSNAYDFNTIAGLMLKLLEHIPQCGESVKWHHFTFEIVDMDGARIDKILVTCPDTENN